MIDALRKIPKEEGFRTLYRGLAPTCTGVGPYVVFEREAREFKLSHSLMLSRECQVSHSCHLCHSFISQENLSNTNAQMHTLKYYENLSRASRSNTGTPA